MDVIIEVPDTSTALIVVDMQNAFVDAGGALAVPGAQHVLIEVNKLIEQAIRRGWPVFRTRDIEPLELPEGDPDHQTDLHPGLRAKGTVVPKGPGRSGGFSAFVLLPDLRSANGPGAGALSPLAGQLRQAGVTEVIVAGVAADVCVAATARDARNIGYRTTVPLRATAFAQVRPDSEKVTVAAMRADGIDVVEA